MNLPDQAARDRFVSETGGNFSVIAPAGVGKTTAIAARILQIARDDARARATGHAPILPRLVVVTYTRKAADEMRNRARGQLVAAGLPPAVLGYFNEAFFGTIHSFLFELLRRFGPLAGLPTRFTIEPDDAALRLAFQRDTAEVADFLPAAARADWRRYGNAAAVWKLVETWPAPTIAPPPPGPCPKVRTAALEAFAPKRNDQRVLKNIARSRERLRRWEEAPAEARALGVPAPFGQSKEFNAEWSGVFEPLREWLATSAAYAAAGLVEGYAKFKESHGCLAYDDFVRLAARLLRDPVLAERIRANEFSVLLDEAQDTDPAQFALLVGVAQPARAPGLWMEGRGAPPAPGRFSMVGDPQQSIFGRADVRVYQQLHERLVESGVAEALTFSVTMRCDQAIVARVNEVFPTLLHGENGQAKFVPLQARPGAGTGKVWRLPIARPEVFPPKPAVDDLVRAKAAALAAWLRAAGPAGAGVDDWSQLAMLAPRRGWLEILAAALRAAGLKAQLHADDRGRGAEPARAWLGAILGILADPDDDFEIIGVLREVFGISDDEIFHWCEASANRHSLRLHHLPPDGAAGTVAGILRLLGKLQRATAALPLCDAVAQAVAETQLGARLAAIFVPSGALEMLLDQAALADARGDNLAAFARQLRQGPAEAVEPVARPGEVQLLTNYKAKGLEWPVVVQFGLFLEPGFPSPKYPEWQQVPPGQPPVCLYDKFHAASAANGENSWKQARAANQRAEFERLLYVAATRPKHALIFVDASALKTEDESLAGVLGVLPGGPARAWWESLPLAGATIPKREIIPATTAANSRAAFASDLSAPAWSDQMLATAQARAGEFLRRVRPSTLATHGAAPTERKEPDLATPPDYPEEQPLPTAAVNYGNWWHELMEDTPWAAGRNAWMAFWEKNYSVAPEPERARREIKLLLASPLAARLAAPGLEFAVELPFLWAEPGGARAFDGCVDLAVWDGEAARWLVIDWKTDFVNGDYAQELRLRYGPQVSVYARALAAMTGAAAETFLYSTRAGILCAP